MKIVATTSLPAVDHPNADRWNAARSRQQLNLVKKELLTGIVPVNKELLTGTVPVNKDLLAGTVPFN